MLRSLPKKFFRIFRGPRFFSRGKTTPPAGHPSTEGNFNPITHDRFETVVRTLCQKRIAHYLNFRLRRVRFAPNIPRPITAPNPILIRFNSMIEFFSTFTQVHFLQKTLAVFFSKYKGVFAQPRPCGGAAESKQFRDARCGGGCVVIFFDPPPTQRVPCIVSSTPPQNWAPRKLVCVGKNGGVVSPIPSSIKYVSRFGIKK